MSTELRVDLIPNGNPDIAMYQASRGLSATNHRLYRQFRTYNMKVKLTAPYNAGIEVYVLKDTWMVRNAIKKACKVYMNTRQMTPGQEDKPARWHDFRIMPTDNTNSEFPQLLPSGFRTDNPAGPLIYNSTSTGQYDYSDVVTQNGTLATTHRFCIGATGSNQFDIIQAYMNLDDTTTDEANSADMYQEFFSTHSPQPDVDDEGDLAPYNMTQLDNYMVKVDTIHNGKTTTANFDALLGWVFFRHNAEIREISPDVQVSAANISGRFQIITDAATTACLQIIHSPGKYKGVRSEPIGKIIKVNQREYDVK